MLFNSLTFLFYFLPCLLVAVYSSFFISEKLWGRKFATKVANTVLVCFSLLFYVWGEGQLVSILLVCVLSTYCIGISIAKLKELKKQKAEKLTLAAGISLNLAILIWFKYSYFGWTAWNSLLPDKSSSTPTLISDIALPLGISFFTFQSISYLVDIHRGTSVPCKNPITYTCYITFFPQLIAGPIVRFYDIKNQLIDRRINFETTHDGISRFIIGLSKKVLIANPVGQLADSLFNTPSNELSTFGSWLAAVAFGIQILFDFSGYTDMAVGLAKLFGVKLPENFNAPYTSVSVRDFWRRWHITLSSWFRDYLYIPLGGSHRSSFRTLGNLIVVFLICGLWHGASFNFVAWGAFHGLFLCLERLGSRASRYSSRRIPSFARRSYTLIVVFAGWVVFRSTDLTQAREMIGYMFIRLESIQSTTLPFAFYSLETQISLLIGIATTFFNLDSTKIQLIHKHEVLLGFLKSTALLILLILCIFSLVASSHNPFIYFRF